MDMPFWYALYGAMAATIAFLIIALVNTYLSRSVDRTEVDRAHRQSLEISECLRDSQALNEQIKRELRARDNELRTFQQANDRIAHELRAREDELLALGTDGMPYTLKRALEDAIAQAQAVKQVQSSQIAAIVTDTMLVDTLIAELKSMRSHGSGHKHNPDKPGQVIGIQQLAGEILRVLDEQNGASSDVEQLLRVIADTIERHNQPK